MTTIAANKRCMAADRRVSYGDTHFSSVKIRRIGKAIVGCAGDGEAVAQFFDWYARKRKKLPDKIEGAVDALVLTAEGLYHYDKHGYPDMVTDEFMAIGSGGMAAVAAMHCGKDPAEAVAIAALVDTGTGGQIDVLEL